MWNDAFSRLGCAFCYVDDYLFHRCDDPYSGDHHCGDDENCGCCLQDLVSVSLSAEPLLVVSQAQQDTSLVSSTFKR
jgi:hypothetical protein